MIRIIVLSLFLSFFQLSNAYCVDMYIFTRTGISGLTAKDLEHYNKEDVYFCVRVAEKGFGFQLMDASQFQDYLLSDRQKISSMNPALSESFSMRQEYLDEERL